MAKGKYTVRELLEIERALEALGGNIDPEREGAEELTYQIADALSALGDSLRTFQRNRQIIMAQYKVKDGNASPEAIQAIDKAADLRVQIEFPAPLDRSAVFRATRVPVPGILARLGPMLAARSVDSGAHSGTQKSPVAESDAAA